MTSTPKAAARAAEDSPLFRTLARIGYVVLGIVHIVIGVIAISIVTGGGGEADQGGAMERIRQTPSACCCSGSSRSGCFALAIWQIAEAFLERNPDTKKKWGYRIKFIGTAVAYIAIAWTALVYALGGQSDSSESSETFSAQLLATPAGVFLLALVGLDRRGDRDRVHRARHHPRLSRSTSTFPPAVARKGIVTFGVVGYVAKGIAVAVAGHPLHRRGVHA